MDDGDREELEVDLLVEVLRRQYGYDFSGYARASLTRRLNAHAASVGAERLAELLPDLVHDPQALGPLLDHLSVRVTEMFRDPPFFERLRKEVVPYLRTFPYVKIWHAGCATGEEVYSMAVLLREEGFLHKVRIYATDINETALERAREGIYPTAQIRKAAVAHQQTGAPGTLSEHGTARYDAFVFDSELRERIVFARHNLATDGSFGEMHLVLSRNVLIYFNRTLQDRVLRLLTDSLVRGGVLCLGTRESLELSEVAREYAPIDPRLRIFRKLR